MDFLELSSTVIFDEGRIRLPVFLGLLILLLLLERLSPRRQRTMPSTDRWFTNFGITVINTVVLRFMAPFTATLTAAQMMDVNFGLFNVVDWPLWFEFLLTIILFDLAIYLQHVATHHIPILWRLHKVHHADRDIDATTALRFHPVEIAFSMLYKVLLVVLLGPTVFAVLVFEIILNGCAMFNHANLRLPSALDRALRLFIVTPDMHRVHHSAEIGETNSNYGFSLSIWDKIFKTYTAQPRYGHDQMTIGLNDYQTDKPNRLLWSLTLPIRNKGD